MHLFLRKTDGRYAARQEITFVRLDMTPDQRMWTMNGHSRPHLFDWNRDGQTDLVLADSLSWNLQVGAGPLVGKTEVLVKPFALAELPDQKPYDFQFADWDGDGLFDVLFVSGYRKPERTRWLYDVYWCRNTARDGKPRFEEPVRLLTAPAQSAGWDYADYAIVDRGRAGCQDLVVSVYKDWKRDPKGGWTINSQLVLYPRRVEPSVPPHPARK